MHLSLAPTDDIVYRVGGGSRLSGLMLAAATAAVMMIGPKVISFLREFELIRCILDQHLTVPSGDGCGRLDLRLGSRSHSRGCVGHSKPSQ